MVASFTSLNIKKILISIVGIFLLCLHFATQAEDKILKVGVAIGEPFAFQTTNGYSGIAIDLWKLIADEQKIHFNFVPMGEHIDEAITQLAQGKIDVLIGPIIPTYDRMKQVDFMRPYYLDQIGFVVPVKRIDFFHALSLIFNSTINTILLVFLFFFIFYLHVFWYYEIKAKQKGPKTYWRGITLTFWLHTLDVDLSEIPSNTYTRQVRFVWLILLTLFFSSITASITSALTIALSDQFISFDNVDDFRNKKITAVIATAPYDIAKEMGLNILPVNNREEAIKLVLRGKVAAYIDYYPIAEYFIEQHQLSHQLTMANFIIKRNTFAFALPINSPLRYPLNLKLREHQEYGLTSAICQKYFTANEKSIINCEI